MEQQFTNDHIENSTGSGNETRVVYDSVPQEPKKQKSHWFLKGVGILLAAVLFGGIAGASMLGVMKLTNAYTAYRGGNEPTVAAEDAQAVQEGSTDAVRSVPQTTLQTAAVSDVPVVFNDVSDVAEAAMPAVVAISGTSEIRYNTWFGPQVYEAEGSGSGILIGENDSEYLIVTNAHVAEGMDELTVTFIDGTTATANVKGTDPDVDIAILAVAKEVVSEDTVKEIKIAAVGDSDSLKVGQGVIAIGNALGFGQSVTVGYISALDREVQVDRTTTRNLLQTDAAINPGNSGGALVNMKGEVIGINSAKYSSTDVEGMGYAIPISKVQDIITRLSSQKTKSEVVETNQGYLGIQGATIDAAAAKVTDSPQGVFVYKILEGSGAAKSALQERDVITAFDGQKIRSMEDLQETLKYYEAGETVTVTVQRLEEDKEYHEIDLEITLGLKAEVQEQ